MRGKTVSMSSLNNAIDLAVRAHAGQFDKADEPYILHPLRVMLKMKTERERIVAVLHDVVEDSWITLESLLSLGYDKEIVNAIDHLTRRHGGSYENFIERVSECKMATRVKIADLEDNMDLTRLKEIREVDRRRNEKYLVALHRLRQALAA